MYLYINLYCTEIKINKTNNNISGTVSKSSYDFNIINITAGK